MITDPSILLQALDHPVRVQLLRLLAERPRIVTELIEATGADQTTVSKHLRVLRDAGLVACDADGRCRNYSLLDPGPVADLLAAIDALAERIASH